MKAILTKVLPCTNHRPTRLKAYTEGGNSLIVSLSEAEGNGDKNQGLVHLYAAEKLRDKMKWTGELLGGGTIEGYAFVFADTWIRNGKGE